MLNGEIVEGQNVSVLDESERESINDFLQGLVWGWCITKGTEEFALRDLLGGVNGDWNGTPLQVLYDKQSTSPNQTKEEKAAISGGHILKGVLGKEKCRNYHDLGVTEMTNKYKWDDTYPTKL